MSTYLPFIVDDEPDELMAGLPAIAMERAKGVVGKTATARRRARTTILLDRPTERARLEADPERLAQHAPDTHPCSTSRDVRSRAAPRVEWIDDVEEGEAMEATVARDDSADPVLVHEDGGVEVAKEAAACFGDVGEGRGEDLRMARCGRQQARRGDQQASTARPEV